MTSRARGFLELPCASKEIQPACLYLSGHPGKPTSSGSTSLGSYTRFTEIPLLEFARNLFHRRTENPGLAFSRPLVVLQSDDWGRVGVRDKEGYERLRSAGLRLGEHSYDLYTLETAADVALLASLLRSHHDSTGRSPCLVMNFCPANLDFGKMRQQGFKKVQLIPLAQGLPGRWSRPGLLEAYAAGVQQGVFYPAVHGLTHFCPVAVENAMAQSRERAQLLRLLWDAETPFIYWRMPWIGYEYWQPEKPHAGFVPAERQMMLVRQACDHLSALFGTKSSSACAPGYRFNRDTIRAWSACGIRVAQNGTDNGLKAPYIDDLGVLHLYRTIDLEPSQKEVDLEKYLQVAAVCFSRGLPFIISIHSINFQSSLKDFRTSSLATLDALLKALESRYPELLYVNDNDVRVIATQGRSPGSNEKAVISVTACVVQ